MDFKIGIVYIAGSLFVLYFSCNIADESPPCGLSLLFLLLRNKLEIKTKTYRRIYMNKNNWKINFFTIWTGQAVSLVTSAVLQMAVIWYLTDTTGSALILSLAAMVGFLPQAVFGAMIGTLVDRWNRKFIMAGADILIAAAGALLAILSFTMELPVWLVMTVLLIRSVGTAFHSPALSAATPLLVPEDKLVKCAGYSQSVQSVSYILSPALAAILYAKWGLNAAILLDILGALAACLAVAIVPIPKQTIKTKTQKAGILAETRAGYEIIKKNTVLFALLWIGALFTFVYMPVNALFPLMSMGHFGGTTIHASVVEITFAAGMLAGGLLLGTWGGFKNRSVSILASFAAMGGSLIISGLLPENGFVIFVLCSAVMGLSAPFYSGIQMALIQEKVQPEYFGRVFGLLGSIMSLAMPLGLIFSGLFADRIGINSWFTLSGICITLLILPVFLLPSMRNIN